MYLLKVSKFMAEVSKSLEWLSKSLLKASKFLIYLSKCEAGFSMFRKRTTARLSRRSGNETLRTNNPTPEKY